MGSVTEVIRKTEMKLKTLGNEKDKKYIPYDLNNLYYNLKDIKNNQIKLGRYKLYVHNC